MPSGAPGDPSLGARRVAFSAEGGWGESSGPLPVIRKLSQMPDKDAQPQNWQRFQSLEAGTAGALR